MLEAVRPRTPHEALRRFFGYDQFRSGQEEIISAVLADADTLVVMPTGGGKSLCYQVPALLRQGVTLVVSPLIALMKDQVDALERRGVKATTINSTLDFASVRQRMTDIRYGLYSLVYVAPERFESRIFIDMLKEVTISLFAVDEAHCISEWGHDFRPSYLRLGEALELLGRPPVIALTATATPFVQEDIVAQLGLRSAKRFVRGFDRPNLSYTVSIASDKDGALREIVSREMKRDGSTIIYCGTRKNVEATGVMLHAEKLPVTIYHAGLRDADRRAAQESFISGASRIIVATNAFGMGIDKADVRHVVHYDMPGSIEAYYQEAGRAGRDGLDSDCTLLYDPRDRRLQEFFIRNSFPTREGIEAVYNALWDALHVGIGSRYEGIFVPDDRDIVSRARIHSASLNGILNILERNGVIRRVRADRLGSVRFIAGSREIQEYYQRTRDEDRKKTILALLRTLGGAALSQETLFNPEELASRHGLTIEAFEQSMRGMMMSSLLRYTPPTPGSGYQFLAERIAPKSVRIDEGAIEKGRSRALLKLDAVERYIRASGCRRDFILEYFCAELDSPRCGRCDCCRGTAAVPAAELRPHSKRASEQLLAAAAELDGRFGKMTLVDLLRGTKGGTVTQFGLERYPRFGELRDMERGELSRLADSLIDNGLLESSATLRPTVRITSAGRKSIAHLGLTRYEIDSTEPDAVANPELLARLRSVRDEAASREGVTPMTLCSDRLLVRIANAMPATRAQFLAIDGATAALYDSCGAAFAGAIEETTTAAEGEETMAVPERLRRTYSLLGQGYTLEEIAHRSALQTATVSNHIEELIKAGAKLQIETLVPNGILKAVREELKKMPRASLRELRALVGGGVDYPHLRVAAAWIRESRTEDP